MHIEYPKILNIKKVKGALVGRCEIEEKLDGANVSIWMEGDEIRMGSRTRILESGFNGFCDYVKGLEGSGVRGLLGELTEIYKSSFGVRLFGEWLVKHTIKYERGYRRFYLFNVALTDEEGLVEWLPSYHVRDLASKYGIQMPLLMYQGEMLSVEDIQKNYVGKSALGPQGEGVVITLLDNAYTDERGNSMFKFKLVTEGFMEENKILFGGNDKSSESYWEMYVMEKYVSRALVEKVALKLRDEQGSIGLPDTPKVIGMVYFDILVENITTIARKVEKLDFRKLKNLVSRKAAHEFKEFLTFYEGEK